MAAKSLRCRECGAEYELEAQYVCERCFGPLEVSYERPEILDVDGLRRRIQAGPQNIWRYADFLPLAAPPGPSARLASRAGLPAGCTPLVRADRLAERLGLREVWVKNDSANPTHSFKDRVVTVAAARARELGFETLACASTGNLANATAATGAALGLETYVFIPSDLEEQKILATGVYGTNLVKVRGNYDDVNRLCTELSGERDWAFVNVNMRPYYAEGSKTVAYEVAEQLGWRTPDRVVAPIASGSLFTKIAKGFQEFSDLGLIEGDQPRMNGAQATGCIAGRDRVRGGPGLLPPRPPDGHRQVAGDRLAGRRSLRARRRPQERRRHRRRRRRRDPRRHPAAGRDDRHLHGDRRRRHDGDAGEARRARRHRARRARRPCHHRRRAEDAGRCARHVHRPRDRRLVRPVRRAGRGRGAGLMAVTVKLPTQLRAAAGGQATAQVQGATVGEALESLFAEHARAARSAHAGRGPPPLRERVPRRRGRQDAGRACDTRPRGWAAHHPPCGGRRLRRMWQTRPCAGVPL